MKIRIILFIVFLFGGLLWAQERNTAIFRPDIVIANYLTDAEMYAALYSGKTEVPYTISFTNHPYFERAGYIYGTLCYNRVVYKDVLMSLDLFRDEISVIHPETIYGIVLNNEKFDYAILNGSTIIKSAAAKGSKVKFLVLLHNGTWQVVKSHKLVIFKEESDYFVRRAFRIQFQYAIYSDGILYPIKNKKAILKLFSDRKKDLNDFAKQHKLNFGKGIEQSIISMVKHYENLTK